MPADTNPAGDIFGGWIMGLMDIAGGITARRGRRDGSLPPRSRNLSFLQPVKVGDVVCCYTHLVRTGRSSIVLTIETWIVRDGRERVKVTAAEFTFVAVDDAGRPRPLLPP